MIRKLLIQILEITLALTVCLSANSQSKVISNGNSCQSYFDYTKISIHYSYSDSIQTHDYSNNWDFDGDGKTDELYFIGTGGAHLYYYLRIILSSDKKIRNFPFIELDRPCLGSISELKSSKFYPPPFLPLFVVDKFLSGTIGNDANDKIYIHIDRSSIIPKNWKKRGVNSTYLLLRYEKGKIAIENFIDSN